MCMAVYTWTGPDVDYGGSGISGIWVRGFYLFIEFFFRIVINTLKFQPVLDVCTGPDMARGPYLARPTSLYGQADERRFSQQAGMGRQMRGDCFQGAGQDRQMRDDFSKGPGRAGI